MSNLIPCLHKGLCIFAKFPRAIAQWYGILTLGVVVILLGLMHVWMLAGLTDAPVDAIELDGGDTTTINREVLHETLDAYARRETTFEALKRSEFELADPAVR